MMSRQEYFIRRYIAKKDKKSEVLKNLGPQFMLLCTKILDGTEALVLKFKENKNAEVLLLARNMTFSIQSSIKRPCLDVIILELST